MLLSLKSNSQTAYEQPYVTDVRSMYSEGARNMEHEAVNSRQEKSRFLYVLAEKPEKASYVANHALLFKACF